MKRTLAATTILGLLAAATGAAAVTLTVPANINTGPYLPFTQLLHINAGGIEGFGQGALAGGGLNKRICADLRSGVDARAMGFQGLTGAREMSCDKHDSTANGVNICTSSASACPLSTHQGLSVRD